MSVLYTCEICGKECEGHFNSRYCPECRGEVIRSTHKESLAKRLAKRRAKRQAKASEGTKPMTLGQIAAKARSLHMSYGQYVAKYGL